MTPVPATPLPCPFCGGKAILKEIPGNCGYCPAMVLVECANPKCAPSKAISCAWYKWDEPNRGTHDRTEEAKAEAIAAWNTRPIQDARVEALKKAAFDLKVAVTFSHTGDFGSVESPNICWIARVPIAFVENLEAALAKLGVSLEGK